VRIKRDEPRDLKRFGGGSFFSCKAKQILGNFQERAIFLWLLSGACPALDAGIVQKKVTVIWLVYCFIS